MSFAINAAPFNNENNGNNLSENAILKKKNSQNKTIKRNVPEFNSAKVNAVIESLQNNEENDMNGNDLGNFQPLNPPTSAGVENTKLRDSNTNTNTNINTNTNTNMNMISNSNMNSNSNNNNVNMNMNYEEELDTDEVDLKSLKSNYMNDKVVKEYYKNLIPNYNSNNYFSKQPNSSNLQNTNNNNIPYYQYQYQQPTDPYQCENKNDIVLTKLNYMINLLEDQQDEKTNNVTEEVILYSFLGIFMIFIVDSFSRVGKYTR